VVLNAGLGRKVCREYMPYLLRPGRVVPKEELLEQTGAGTARPGNSRDHDHAETTDYARRSEVA
jgi:hypothetical protein